MKFRWVTFGCLMVTSSCLMEAYSLKLEFIIYFKIFITKEYIQGWKCRRIPIEGSVSQALAFGTNNIINHIYCYF